ncbi:hypothetical protein [Halorubrum depositum]|uniref:hypothetical protein n=1 Tax=Halorubrum depositum TaxID=2583992 RepID=UPI0011A16094|nr:hypothetical protein [Halorubrum depositum]
MGKFRVRVKNEDRVIRDIKRDFKRGMDKSAEKIAESGREKALEIINRNQAYFNYEVAKGFRIIDAGDTPTRSSIKFVNEAPHAGALDAGVPAAKYADGGPPVQALLPWVARKMQGFSLGDSDSDGGGNGSVFDVGPDVPRSLTGRYDRDDVEEGDRVYIKYDEDIDYLVDVVEKNDDSFVALQGDGSRYDVDYSDIISPFGEHPSLDTTGRADVGDRVYWYDEDGNLLHGYVTGDAHYIGYNRRYVVEELDSDESHMVPVTRVLQVEDRPEYDDSFADPSMKQVFIRDSAGGKAQMAYYNAEVVAYDEHSGQTARGTVTSPPINLNDNFKVELDTGEEVEIGDSLNGWVIRHLEDFTEVSEARQRELMLGHFDEVVAKTDGDGGVPTAQSIQNLRDGVEDFILPSYRDREHLGRVIFEWEKARIRQDRDHVGVEKDGWRLQHTPSSGQQWETTLAHEFGHAYSQPTDTQYSVYGNDPMEHKFMKPWSKRNDASHSHMYEDGLPKWNPYDEENAVHTYIEAYMARDNSDPNRVRFSNGNLVEDNRDQLEPYGFHDWEDEVEELARLETQGTSPATEALKDHIQELTPQQVLKPDDMKLEQGDFIAVRKDGEVEILEFTGWDGPNSPTSFVGGEEDTPSQAIAYGFKKPHEKYGDEGFYVGEDGTIYDTVSDDWGDYYLSKEAAPEFVGMIDQRFYDESLDVFPELTTPESEPHKRLQEAANMALWYQIVHIANDQSPNKADSKEIVFRNGYSATVYEEVMATFNEALTVPNPSRKQLRKLRTLVDTYPYFIEAYLLTKKPVSAEAEKVLKDEGFL